MNITKDQILHALAHVVWPEKNKNLVDLNMIENLNVQGNKVSFTILFPGQNNPLKKSIEKACRESIINHFGDEIEIEIMSTTKISVAQLDASKVNAQPLTRVKNIIAVASGKGGVGKSTISVNLACALALQGLKVGILDADVYGPSIPKMFNMEDERPSVRKIAGKEMIVPLEQYGVKMLSIGFFVRPEDALIWRGPMATSALKQLMDDGLWGDLDYLIIDVPPGTGDIHLTLVQTIPVTGAIIVTTPQEVALADAKKAIAMFRQDKINVPILGLVENMAWFTPEELPNNKYYLFGKEGGKNLAERMNIALLGQIPLVQGICEDGDSGQPSALRDDSIVGKAFEDLANMLIKKVDERNANMEATKVVEITNTDGCAAK